MKPLMIAVLIAMPMLAGCVSANGPEGRQAEAYSKCRYAPGAEAREKCMKTELALIEARERNEAQREEEDRQAAERRQAELQAMGVPEDKAKQSHDSGLRPPR